jgi:hypothetical protein
MLEEEHYDAISHQIKPGDIIAFSGNSLFSRWAKFTSGSVVTHVAIVMRTNVYDATTGSYFNQVIEATSYNGERGVMLNKLCDRVITYCGDMWWLPLGDEARKDFEQNKESFFTFMFAQDGEAYDIRQLFGSVIDTFDDHPVFGPLTYNQEDFTRWFCSELVAEGLKQAGVINGVNASEVTPVDICRFAIFGEKYVQVKGESKRIVDFNCLPPNNWGQIA